MVVRTERRRTVAPWSTMLFWVDAVELCKECQKVYSLRLDCSIQTRGLSQKLETIATSKHQNVSKNTPELIYPHKKFDVEDFHELMVMIF